MEAVLNQAENQSGNQVADAAPGRVSRFGSTTDAVEAGRAGGRASVLSRRLRHQRQLEAAVFERSKNGYALLKLAEKEEHRNRELDRARIEADNFVCRLMDDADRERATIAGLIEQTRTLEAQVVVLEARRLALDSDDALDTLLSEIGVERASESAVRLGWDSDDETQP